MNPKAQFIYDDAQQPLYAILPFAEYMRLQGEDQPAPQKPSLLSNDRLSIRLPNGGPDAHIDLPRFVDYFCKAGLLSIPINQRAKKFSEFGVTELLSLEGLIRGCFLKKNSSYRNTMQATNDVVAALVETGMFKEVRFYKAKLRNNEIFNRAEALVPDNDTRAIDEDDPLSDSDFHKFSRTVKCIEGVESELIKFNTRHPHTGPRINNHWFRDPAYKPDFLA